MTLETGWLCGAAALVGLVHTLLGPDHYLPFVAMSRVGRWSLKRTITITTLCGLGHVVGSVVLGFVGIALGAGFFRLEAIERFRGDVAGWLLLTFGLVYLIWGARRAFRHQSHSHWHAHADGTVHEHEHLHTHDHLHVHDLAQETGASPFEAANHAQPLEPSTDTVGRMTPWVLFTIFLFGPCEPLIPLLMYPAAKGEAWSVVLVTMVFAATTLATMATVVALAWIALQRAETAEYGVFARLDRFSHAVAGLVLTLCGVAVQMGL